MCSNSETSENENRANRLSFRGQSCHSPPPPFTLKFCVLYTGCGSYSCATLCSSDVSRLANQRVSNFGDCLLSALTIRPETSINEEPRRTLEAKQPNVVGTHSDYKLSLSKSISPYYMPLNNVTACLVLRYVCR